MNIIRLVKWRGRMKCFSREHMFIDAILDGYYSNVIDTVGSREHAWSLSYTVYVITVCSVLSVRLSQELGKM